MEYVLLYDESRLYILICLTVKCLEKERKTLLAFKESLIDPSGRLSSWVGENFCTWIGVGCDNRTRHVVKLDLKNPVPVFDTRTNEVSKAFKKSCLGDKISPSLLELKLLSYLDLSLNYFNGDDIPTFLGSLESLRYLNLSFSSFGGVITPHLGNLSRLQYLDLNSLSFFDIFSRLEVESLHWLAGFPSLKYLSMSHVVNLYKASDWLQAVNVLPSLSELHLGDCGLLSNLSDLTVLNLASNTLCGQLPSSLGNLTNLHILDLSGNKFIGEIPSSFANLSQLQTFDQKSNNVSGEIVGLPRNLASCSFWGSIPSSIGKWSSSQELFLSKNQMNGSISETIGNLSMLVSLYLDYNFWEGALTEAHFQNLSRLEAMILSVSDFRPCSQLPSILSLVHSLDLSNNNLSGEIPDNITSLSKFINMNLSANQLNGKIPENIGNIHDLESLDLSRSELSGPIPKSLSALNFLSHLNLSFNNLSGQVTIYFVALLFRTSVQALKLNLEDHQVREMEKMTGTEREYLIHQYHSTFVW
ncbi:hypothetical protein I3842_09G118000 [Carya illinoinensis]|uniref:Leucine-rich repeat-containing N-terminal plant-type domain-containing protein n=1 Tax=Carya illinoinensis TaxID=32201 RepID=A0A922J7C0_CARIL|nr:hypothetical protein I3842_09G118000 [Carya illinoinensis]